MFIPYARQSISDQDIAAVSEVLRSDFLTQGPAIPNFETALATYCGAKHAVAVNSATSALHIACLALGVGPGDIVWTNPISFVASANCALYCGAKVDFVDIDPDTFNISVAALTAKLEQAKKSGSLPRVVIPVHLAGQSSDMAAIHALAQEYGFKIIEDASHAVGGTYNGSPVGSCLYSDITVLSFHPVKIITSGEGGMALTNSASISAGMERLRSHGITRDKNFFQHVSDGPWYYEQIDLGLNYRLTDIAAALGLSQFQRLDSFVARRNEIARDYDSLFSGSILTTPTIHDDVISAFHLYVIRMAFTGDQKQRFFELAHKNGVGLNVHYIPIYRQPYYSQMGFDSADFPVAEKYYSEAVSIPMYADLTFEQQQHVASVLISTAATVSH
jgi:UDP-4-amino-4,6-dideoxy-N-acetyl-beta-L-altrosamine transaminase